MTDLQIRMSAEKATITELSSPNLLWVDFTHT